jgi:hypothetical protein
MQGLAIRHTDNITITHTEKEMTQSINHPSHQAHCRLACVCVVFTSRWLVAVAWRRVLGVIVPLGRC